MASIAVVFELDHAETKMGQAVAVVGRHTEMGTGNQDTDFPPLR